MEDADVNLVTVTCPNHHQTLVSGFWYFLTSKYRVDGALHAEGRSVSAHQLVVDVFLPPKLDPNGAPIDHQHQNLLDTTAEKEGNSHLDHLLEFMYHGTVTLPNNRMDGLLRVARELDFKMLVDAVELAKKSESLSWQNEATSDSDRADTNVFKRGHVDETCDVASKFYEESSDSDGDWMRPIEPAKLELKNSDSDSDDAPSLCVDDELQSEKWSDSGDTFEPAPKKKCPPNPVNDQRRDFSLRKRSTTNAVVRGTGKILSDVTITPSVVSAKTKPPPANKQVKTATTSKPPQVLRRCPHCPWQTRNATHLRVHLAKHDPTVKLYRCDLCNRPFTCPDSMAHHRLRHADEPDVYQCEYCEYSAPKRQTLKSHLNYRHRALIGRASKVKSSKCTLCNFACVYPSQLRLHVMIRHTGEKPIKCSECNYSTVRSTDLAKHVRVVHRGIKLFICEICGLKCGHGGALKQHMRTHSKEKPFACLLCDKAYGHSSQLKEHEKWHADAPKPHVCHVCGHAFRRRDHLRTHLRGVHKLMLVQESNPETSDFTVFTSGDAV